MTKESKQSQVTVSQRRRERERTEMRQKIMEAARSLFVKNGYEAVTLAKIAKVIEYTPAIVYQHFANKQALVMAIIEQDQEDLRRHLLGSISLENPVERLFEMAHRYATWGISHPNHYQLLLMPPASWMEQQERLNASNLSPLEQEALVLLFQTVQEAIEQGLLKNDYPDPSLVAATLWAGIHGTVLLEISMSAEDKALLGNASMRFEDRFDTLKQVFVDGFLKKQHRYNK